MRAFLLLILFAPQLAFSQVAAPLWQVLEAAPVARHRFDDVTFVSPSLGWVVSTDGEIWKTADGGVSWTRQQRGTGDRFRSVAFRDDQVGFVGTVFGNGSDPRVLFETRDGGEHWTSATARISGPVPAGICGLWAVDDSVLFGVGAFHGDPTLIRTADGGDTWESLRLDDLVGALIDVWFRDRDTGFAVGGTGTHLDGNAVIIRTDDGGDTWTRVHETTRDSGLSGEWAWKISFVTDLVGYVSVEYASGQGSRPAKILKTVDGGDTWSEILIEGSTEPAGLQGIGFISETVGWTSGRGTTSITIDGGSTWTQVSDWSDSFPDGQLDGAVNRFFPVNDTLAYAIGKRVYRLTTSGTVVSREPYPVIPRLFEVGPAYPNPTTGPVTLPLTLDRPAQVRVWIIDLLGRMVRDYRTTAAAAGAHPITWDGRDDSGRKVAPGPYLVLFDVGDSMEMKQVVMMR